VEADSCLAANGGKQTLKEMKKEKWIEQMDDDDWGRRSVRDKRKNNDRREGTTRNT
jgi:hypothetical protein